MFGKKQKIEIAIDSGRASRRIVSDIMPARSTASAERIVKKSAMSEISTKPIDPPKPLPPIAKPSGTSARPTGPVKAGAQARVSANSSRRSEKFDFLTRRPIAKGAFPKLPEKPGAFSRFQDQLGDFAELVGKKFRSEQKAGEAIMTAVSARAGKLHRISPRLANFGLAAILIFIFGGGFFLLNVFASMTVEIMPKTETIAVDKTFSVAKNSDPVNGIIAGEMMTFRQAVEASKETTGMLDANSKARGRIVIYNAYSAEPQTLVKRTRFETPEGKIYRLVDGTTVPGTMTKSGQTTPGSIEVAVEADQAGEEYNLGLTDFTIPGFKGTARYTKFYGRSKTPMAGGSTSQKRVTARADIDALKGGLATQLEDTIKSEYSAKVPEGFKLLDGAYAIAFEDAVANPPLDSEGNNVTVALAGNFRGLLIKKELLAEAIATAYGKDGLAGKAHVENVDDLAISVVRKNLDSNEMTIHVTGQARFVWNIDAEAIVSDFLAGKSSVEIFGAHEGIEKAQVEFSPSWWHFIPKNKDKIHINLVGA